MALAYDTDDKEETTDKKKPNAKLMALATHPGNLTDALEDKELVTIGGDAVREWQYDKDGRSKWEDSAKKAMKIAVQERDEKKTPWPNASNIQYPILTTATIQFAARAYPALIKGDTVLKAKVVGADPLGFKAQRAKRLEDFCNDQILYEIDEWEPGTDTLLHSLPILGQGFRKMGWDPVLDRPRADFASALNVYADIGAPTLDQAPRVTEWFQRYPFYIAQMMRAKSWREVKYDTDSDDTQKPCEFIEQHRYMDLDGDGLPEPYIVTVELKNEQVVRIDPAFDPEDIRTGEKGQVEAVTRMLPWIDYTFLPDPQGGLYGMGFGRLLESLQGAIDTALNQMMDAGHLANAPGGFIAQGLNIRGGSYAIEPNKYRFVNAPGSAIRDAIYTHQFPGPSPVLFQLVDMLLAAAKDITSVKDVLTGEAPSQQPATSTLALIEQGLSVFTAIYKRIYRSMRKEYKYLFMLNGRYLSPERYKDVLDAPLTPPNLPKDNPPPPNVAMTIQKMMQKGVTPDDFSNKDYDIRPVSDPAAVTQMQQLAKAEFLRGFKGDPTVNQTEINKRMFDAARIDQPEKLLDVPPNPMGQIQVAGEAAKVDNTKADTAVKTATAEKLGVEAKGAAFDEGAKQGILGSVAGQSDDGMVSQPAPAPQPGSGGDGDPSALGQPDAALGGAAGPMAGPSISPSTGGEPPL